jgi:tRNA (cytidine56-2'-O)-methyltransferase
MKGRKVFILRLDHRPQRDKRVTTHLFLAARALGADGGFYTGERDEKIQRSVEKVTEAWGGDFEVSYITDWKKKITEWKEKGGEVIHLTMYGLPLQQVIGHIRNLRSDLLVVVGGPKVPGSIYELADWNVSVTSQPHSEISALALFLHELFEGRELFISFKDARIIIDPQAKGKKVLRLDSQR